MECWLQKKPQFFVALSLTQEHLPGVVLLELLFRHSLISIVSLLLFAFSCFYQIRAEIEMMTAELCGQ